MKILYICDINRPLSALFLFQSVSFSILTTAEEPKSLKYNWNNTCVHFPSNKICLQNTNHPETFSISYLVILTVKLARLDFTQILIFWQSVKIMHLFRQGRQEKHLNLICLATSEGQLSKCFRGIKSKVVLSL